MGRWPPRRLGAESPTRRSSCHACGLRLLSLHVCRAHGSNWAAPRPPKRAPCSLPSRAWDAQPDPFEKRPSLHLGQRGHPQLCLPWVARSERSACLQPLSVVHALRLDAARRRRWPPCGAPAGARRASSLEAAGCFATRSALQSSATPTLTLRAHLPHSPLTCGWQLGASVVGRACVVALGARRAPYLRRVARCGVYSIGPSRRHLAAIVPDGLPS